MKTLRAAVGLGLRAAHWPRRSGIPQRWEVVNLNGASASSTLGGTHSHESFRDARIRAAFAIAPVLAPAMTKASLAEVKVPVRIIVGSKDDQAFPGVNAMPIASAIPNAELEITAPGKETGADAIR